MDPLDPILDQPQVIDYDEIDPAATYRLANQDLYFDVDANSDLHDPSGPGPILAMCATSACRSATRTAKG